MAMAMNMNIELEEPVFDRKKNKNITIIMHYLRHKSLLLFVII